MKDTGSSDLGGAVRRVGISCVSTHNEALECSSHRMMQASDDLTRLDNVFLVDNAKRLLVDT